MGLRSEHIICYGLITENTQRESASHPNRVLEDMKANDLEHRHLTTKSS